MVKIKVLIAASLICGALAGCTSRGNTATSGVFHFQSVVTPTRIGVSDNGNKYWVDLALMVPVEKRCEKNSSRCAWLHQKMEGKQLLISNQYSRYGVEMSSVWVIDGDGVNGVSVNLEAVLEGAVEGDDIDFYSLPEHLGKTLQAARALRSTTGNLNAQSKEMKPWMIERVKLLESKYE